MGDGMAAERIVMALFVGGLTIEVWHQHNERLRRCPPIYRWASGGRRPPRHIALD